MAIKKLTRDELEALAQNITAPVTKELIERQENLEVKLNELISMVAGLRGAVEGEVLRKNQREKDVDRQLQLAQEASKETAGVRKDFDDLLKHVGSIATRLDRAISANRTDVDALLRWRDHLLARLATLER